MRTLLLGWAIGTGAGCVVLFLYWLHRFLSCAAPGYPFGSGC